MSIYQDLISKQKSISVIGLGYVGLPLALAFARKYKVLGYDIKEERINQMKQGIDPSKELEKSEFENTDIEFSFDAKDLRKASFHVVCVPTDINDDESPNLEPLKLASEHIGKALRSGDYVVYESTVFPGCTEEECLPILMNNSGLTLRSKSNDQGFNLGYSPERIVPGKQSRKLKEITKIVAGHNDQVTEEIAKVYQPILDTEVFCAPSIKVAEASKVLENTQRDLNISLMNEMAIICDKLGIATSDVIEAASTKWNFQKYTPGLVGGHCISVDPFFLIHKAKQHGLDPQVIAAGRQVNEYIPKFVAQRVVQTLIEKGKAPGESKVLVMGVTFKENVSDIRNSKVADLIQELMNSGNQVHIIDPLACNKEVEKEYGISLIEQPKAEYDAIIVAVSHDVFLKYSISDLKELSKDKLNLFDIKGLYSKSDLDGVEYWQL